MINPYTLLEIKPKAVNKTYSAEHVSTGIPVPKQTRLRGFSPNEWEEFAEEWSNSLKDIYQDVRRFGGANDLGVDVAAFASDNGFSGTWDNFQCKHYHKPLTPSDIWKEIGKVVFYSFKGEYTPPRKYYFIASQDIGTKLGKLLKNNQKLKAEAKSNWEQYCQSDITETEEIPLTGEMEEYFDGFDFSIFTSKSSVQLIEMHANTTFHAVRFGGGLPPRSLPDAPPIEPASVESRYLRHLLDAYGDHLQVSLGNEVELDPHPRIKRDYQRQRERFFHAEGLRNFARDTVPEGTFEQLLEDIFDGVIDTCESDHQDGLARLRSALSDAASISVTASPLSSALHTKDKQGICHQLANVDRLVWVKE